MVHTKNGIAAIEAVPLKERSVVDDLLWRTGGRAAEPIVKFGSHAVRALQDTYSPEARQTVIDALNEPGDFPEKTLAAIKDDDKRTVFERVGVIAKRHGIEGIRAIVKYGDKARHIIHHYEQPDIARLLLEHGDELIPKIEAFEAQLAKTYVGTTKNSTTYEIRQEPRWRFPDTAVFEGNYLVLEYPKGSEAKTEYGKRKNDRYLLKTDGTKILTIQGATHEFVYGKPQAFDEAKKDFGRHPVEILVDHFIRTALPLHAMGIQVKISISGAGETQKMITKRNYFNEDNTLNPEAERVKRIIEQWGKGH
ncbi:MAG: hypothetical protein FJY77_01490 [Candidatus Altiarchaeales archaeon]|nr:hypothetical protein [Candidatus Altiarchaeales archaeon]